MSRYNSLFWRTLTLNRSVTRTALIPVSIASTLCTSWHTLTGGAGPVGHPGDESLLLAGRLSPVALVLVGVSVWAAHRDVVFVTLEIKHNQMLIKLQCDNGDEPWREGVASLRGRSQKHVDWLYHNYAKLLITSAIHITGIIVGYNNNDDQ